jgi:hypothetical protein
LRGGLSACGNWPAAENERGRDRHLGVLVGMAVELIDHVSVAFEREPGIVAEPSSS